MLSKIAFASCFGERFNLTQILLNKEDKHALFTCHIKQTYYGSGGYTSIAVVKDVFRGTPMDTIRIVTGGHTTAGGTKIKPGTNWLIISESKDNYHFTATICHNLSKPLTQEDVGCGGYSLKVHGEDFNKCNSPNRRPQEFEIHRKKTNILARFTNCRRETYKWLCYRYLETFQL